MRLLTFLANAVLTAAAALGVLCALAWGATAVGWIQPLVVVSGSMEPAIATGDLLVATRAPVARLEVGEVATLRSSVTGSLVTHRVTAVDLTGRDTAEVRMQGDANHSVDGETYVVAGSVWRPAVRLPGGGYVIETLARPTVVAPLLLAVLALVAMTLVPDGRKQDDDGAPAAVAHRPAAKEAHPA